MFRNFLIVILLNGCCQSAIIPDIHTKQLDENNIGNALSELAKSCKNSFLATQINSKVEECTTLPKPQLKFKCLIFYDINSKLCGTTSATDTNIENDYASYRKKPQDLLELCTGAKAWNLSDSLVSARYKSAAESIFHKATRCVKLCETDDIMSTDVDFFCDYYNWGTNMLNALKQLSQIDATGQNGAHQNVTSTQVTKKDENSSSGNEENALVPDSVPQSEDQKANLTQTNSDAVDEKKSISKTPMNQDTLTLTNGINTNSQDTAALPPARPNDNKISAGKPEDKPEEPVSSSGVAGIKLEIPIKDHDSKGDQVMNLPETEQKPDTSKLKSQPADDEYQGFQDSEEGKEGLPDEQTGDDEDPELADADRKGSQVIDKPAVQDKTVQQQEFVQKDIGVSSFPDGYSYENDDHFFSFFLSAIIIVVILYVLYHNKSKVTKVVMGLIVEGRQPGRRRNSRGHAYKRLDTLEQAMTAKSSTPPSKIIY